ncbi:hypothetical protein RQP46_000886 [Phenoliferia psychrophenolica]
MTPPLHDIVRVSIILDGDGDKFAREFYAGGEVGGRNAAIQLREKVQEMVARKRNVELGRVLVTIGLVFCNATGLAKYHNLHSLDGFKRGFNSSPYPMLLSDAGSKAEAADEQVKSHLEGQAYSCDVLVLGGTHDGGYANTIQKLQPDLRRKIIFLRANSLFAPTLAAFRLDVGYVDGLFAYSLKKESDFLVLVLRLRPISLLPL